MENILSNISFAISFYPMCVVLGIVPFIVIPMIRKHSINLIEIGLSFAFVFYLIGVMALVFFPLPDLERMAKLTSYDAQLIPFAFVGDIIRESPLCITDASTYIPALTHRAVWQVLFNIIMTIPFGMYLAYAKERSKKAVILESFCLSLFIELAQLTGLFFIYSGSYRLCDIDDLMLNTLGGFLGYLLVAKLKKYLPEKKALILYVKKHRVAHVTN